MGGSSSSNVIIGPPGSLLTWPIARPTPPPPPPPTPPPKADKSNLAAVWLFYLPLLFYAVVHEMWPPIFGVVLVPESVSATVIPLSPRIGSHASGPVIDKWPGSCFYCFIFILFYFSTFPEHFSSAFLPPPRRELA